MNLRKFAVYGMICVLAGTMCCGCGKKDDVAEDVDTEGTESAGVALDNIEYGSTNFSADLTHDGSEEVITVTVSDEAPDGGTAPTVELTVSSGSKQIFYDTPLLDYLEGDSYYLTYIDGEAYLMRYKPFFDGDEATDEYEVFSLDSDGNRQQYAVGSIEVSCYNIDDIDSAAWVNFAGMVDKYRSDAKLLVSTLNGELECGSPDSTDSYTENLDWLVTGDSAKNGTATDNLSIFIDESRKAFGFWDTSDGDAE